MAALIGVVSKVIGQVFVVSSDGTRRAVVNGERLYAGQTLDTGTEGAIAVHLTSGNELTLGRGSSLHLDASLLSDHPPSIVVNEQVPADGSQLTAVQQAQQAIAAGADPTQTLEPTAAGNATPAIYTNTPAGELGGGHSFVLLTETAGVVTPTVGFPTAGLAFGIIDPVPLVAEPLVTAAAVTPVVPPVVVPPNDTPSTPNEPPVGPNPPDNGITFVDLYRDGGEQRVFEADLPNGTNTAQGKGGDLSRTDVFSVVAPDGLASLTIDGIQVVSNGALVPNTADGTVVIVGQLGNTLTINSYDPTTGVFGYTYVLSVDQHNNLTTSNTELSEDFHLVAQDTDGDTGDAWLNVRIEDDNPIANNDTAAVTQQNPEVTGTVLANDFVGADTNALPVSISAADNPGLVVTGNTVIGTYGTLTLNADGTYTYVLNTDTEAFAAYKASGVAATDTFTYTLTDGDGDTSKATLTVDLAANHDVSINWTKASGGDLIFSEGDLPNGTSTQPDKANWLTDHSSVYVDAKDGLASLTVGRWIDGQFVTTDVIKDNALVGGSVTVVGESGNVLTFTGYDPTTGILSYTYTLDHAVTNNAPGVGDALANLQLSDDFKLVATDTDGDNASAWINITIKDDAPIAVDDTGATTVTDKTGPLEGSVLTNDKVGADSNATPVSITAADNPGLVVNGDTVIGKYGTLTLNADGTYTYAVNAASEAFQALKASGHGGTETFTYTLTDGDGDKTTATLTLDVNANHGVEINWTKASGGDLIFSEGDLPNGTSVQPDKASWLTDHSSVYIDAKDGLATLTVGRWIDGQFVTTDVVKNNALVSSEVTVVGESGNVLTFTGYDATTGILSYTYVLDHAVTNNAPGVGDPTANLQLSDDFKLVATDPDGDSDSAWINITIKDDTPQAVNDSGTVSEKITQLTGDVLTNDKVGADTNATPVSIRAEDNQGLVVNGDTVTGKYGTLVLNTDGTYTYTLNTASDAYQDLKGGHTATETFTYTLTDGDGDSTTANLVVDVKGDYGVNITIDCDTLVVQESNLPGGSTATPLGNQVDGTLTVTAPDGLLNLNVGGVQVMTNGVLINFNDPAQASITTPEGNLLTINGIDLTTGEVQYTYTMTHALDHNQGDGTSITENFSVVAQDTDGDTQSASFAVQVVDDTPTAAPLEATTTSGATGTNVLLIIDVSNSMNDKVAGTDQTRLDLAKQAVDQMLAQYADIGDVRVQVTTFNNHTQQLSSTWVTVDQAVTLVNQLTAGGGTNYDYALDGAQTAFDAAGKLTAAGTQNVSYFVSDGNPTLSSQIDHVTSQQSGNKTEPGVGDGIDSGEEADWVSFLQAHDIKSYAIGIGSSPSATYLDPIAYNGAADKDTGAILVRNISDLPDTLSGLVQGKPVTGSLTDGGGFGADGGYVKSISVDGVKYSFNGTALSAGADADASKFQYNATTHQLMVSTEEGGALMVNMLTGQYSYVAPTNAAASFTETVLFTLTDADGDTSSNALSVHVIADAAVTAGTENIITNVLDSSIVVPTAALLANASDGTHLTSTSTFNTGWSSPGADFKGAGALTFNGTRATLDRAQFANNAAAMSAALVVAGALGMVGSSQASDTLTVELKKGETVHLDNTLSASHASLSWAAAGDQYTAIGSGGSFTATEDGVYKIHVTNITDPNGSKAAESYKLSLTVDYSHVETTPLVHTDTYTVADDHGAKATGAVAIHYQAGDHLVGTNGNDVLIAGDGDNKLEGGKGDDVLVAGKDGNELYGNDGNDLLIGGAGNDILDGGAGNNTASYQAATKGVHVDLHLQGVQQDTVGAGHDLLSNIQNLIGSDHNDVLIGDAHDNILIGGKGNDTLTGGGGNDTFKWQAGDTGHDTVTDFKLGNDTLDLSQLLKGENSVADSLENFLQFKVSGSGDSLVSTIEISSSATNTTNQTISLNHVDLASAYGVQVGAGNMVASGHDTATIINGMLSDHSLKADTV